MSSLQFEILSKEELDKSKEKKFAPVKAGNYISKISKVQLVKSKRYQKEGEDWKFMVWFLLYQQESGMPVKDIENKEYKPLERWVLKWVPPATGFQNSGVPSAFRALIMYSKGLEITGKLALKDFYLIDAQNNLVMDEQLKQQYLMELRSLDLENRQLVKSGYVAIGKLDECVGSYVSCALTINDKDQNLIGAISPVPENFQPNLTLESVAMKSFNEVQEKLKGKYEKGSEPNTVLNNNLTDMPW